MEKFYDFQAESVMYAELTNINEYASKMREACDCKQNNIHHTFNVAGHIIRVADIAKTIAPGNANLVLAAALHDIEKPSCKTTVDGVDKFIAHAVKSAETAKVILDMLHIRVMLRYGRSAFDVDYVVWLVKHHEITDKLSTKTMKKWCREYESLNDLWTLRQCDLLAQSTYQRAEKLEILAYNMKLEESIRQLPEFQQIYQP